MLCDRGAWCDKMAELRQRNVNRQGESQPTSGVCDGAGAQQNSEKDHGYVLLLECRGSV